MGCQYLCKYGSRRLSHIGVNGKLGASVISLQTLVQASQSYQSHLGHFDAVILGTPLYEDLILTGNSDKDLDDGDVDELMASQLEKERNRISLKRQSNIQKSLSNPVSPTESTM